MRNPGLSRDQLLELHRFMRLNRMLEDKLTALYRQGRITGGLYSSLGQEAISVGTAYALEPGDLLAPMIRNIGSCWCAASRRSISSLVHGASRRADARRTALHFGNVSRWRWSARSAISGPWCR